MYLPLAVSRNKSFIYSRCLPPSTLAHSLPIEKCPSSTVPDFLGTKKNSRLHLLNNYPRLLHPSKPPLQSNIPPKPLRPTHPHHRKHQTRGPRITHDRPRSPRTNRRCTDVGRSRRDKEGEYAED